MPRPSCRQRTGDSAGKLLTDEGHSTRRGDVLVFGGATMPILESARGQAALADDNAMRYADELRVREFHARAGIPIVQ